MRRLTLGIVVVLLGTLLWTRLAGRSEGDAVTTEAVDVERDVRVDIGGAALADVTGADEERVGATADPSSSIGLASNDNATGAAVWGLVLDAQRRPVADVEVHLHLGGRPPLGATTDGAGHYRFPAIPLPRLGLEEAYLHACTGDDRCAVGAVVVPRVDGGSAQARDLILEPSHSIVVDVTEGGAHVQGADVSIDAGYGRIRVGRGVSDVNGRVRFVSVPLGSVQATARLGAGEGSRLGRTAVASEAVRTSGQITVELVPTRTVTVSVTDPGSGEPVEGARVRLIERAMPDRASWHGNDPFGQVTRERELLRPSAITGANGIAVLEGVVRWPLRVEASIGKPGSGRTSNAKLDASAETVVLELKAASLRPLVRWPITGVEGAVLEDGTELVITTVHHDGVGAWPTVAVVSGEQLLARGVPDGRFRSPVAMVTTADGRVGRLHVDEGETTGEPTELRYPRTVTVRVWTADGEPAPGWRVMGIIDFSLFDAEVATTGAEGVARFDGLMGELFMARILPRGVRYGGWSSGTVDISQAGGEIDFVLPHLFHQTLLVTVDGVPRLPAKLAFRQQEIIAEDPASGTVVAALFLSEHEQSVELHASSGRDLLDIKFEVTRAQLELGVPIPLALQSGCSLLVEVKGRPDLNVELFVETKQLDGSWERFGFESLAHPNADDGRFRFTQLVPGEYRVRDLQSGAIADSVELQSAHVEPLVTLDATGAGMVSGRIEGPAGADMTLARVSIEGEGAGGLTVSNVRAVMPGWPPRSVAVGSNGGFVLPSTMDTTLTLRAWHPLFSPSPDGGEVTVEGLRDDVRLELQAGPTVVWDRVGGA